MGFVCSHTKLSFKVSELSLDSIYLRDNPYVSKSENKSARFARNHFFETPIFLDRDSCIVDTTGTVLVRLFKHVVPEHLLQMLDTVIEKYSQVMQLKAKLSDSRGTARVSTRLGSYVEQGGSGQIWVVKGHDWCPELLKEIDEIGKFVDSMYK